MLALLLLLHPRTSDELVRHEVDVHVRQTVLLRLETDDLRRGVDVGVTFEALALGSLLDERIELRRGE